MPLSDVLRKKLREAQYFLRQMNAVAMRPIGDAEEFEFLLSAFLSASRSITNALENRRYGAWFTAWQSSRTSSDTELLEFMRVQRIAEVHRDGADVEARVHFIPITEVRRADRSHPAYGFHVFGPGDIEPASVGVTAHWFELGGTQIEAADACRRIVSVLSDLVDAFRTDHPDE
jgi:hypothetical protein